MIGTPAVVDVPILGIARRVPGPNRIEVSSGLLIDYWSLPGDLKDREIRIRRIHFPRLPLGGLYRAVDGHTRPQSLSLGRQRWAHLITFPLLRPEVSLNRWVIANRPVERERIGSRHHSTNPLYSPLTIILSTLMVGAAVPPKDSTSLPTIVMAASMSRRLPAMLISFTGYVSLPSSIQKPAAP